MDLKAELSVKLEAGPLVQKLLTDIGGPLANLRAVASPVSGTRLAGASAGAARLDITGVGDAAARLAQQMTPLIGSLPAAGAVLGPLTTSLELVEKLSVGDLAGQLRSLSDKLSRELSGSREGGFIAVLLRLGDVLATAPEGRALLELLTALTRAGGAELPAGILSFPNALPAADNLVRAIGGLMALESVLSEADRLTGLMAEQVDAPALSGKVSAVLACFGEGPSSLASFVTRLDPASPAEVQSAVAAIGLCAEKLEALRADLAAAMGFGEATLVYLDVGQVQAELEAAAAMVRSADLAPVERAAQSIADLLRPLLAADLSTLPSFSLEQLLATIEGRVAEFAGKIREFDGAALAAPLQQGIGALTGIVSALADVLGQVTISMRAALDQVRQGVAALPFDQIAVAVRTALQPITEVLDAIRRLVEEIESALRTAAESTTQALGQVEHVVEEFKAAVDALFGEAKAFVATLHLDQVVGQVADRVKAFADVLAKAQMQPYFDTAAGAIETTADVISAVPFGLLPDSMKAELDAAVKPIKEADAGAVQIEIEDLLQITEGRFQLRAELEPAIAQIRQKYDELLAAIRAHDPHTYVAQLDAKLTEVTAKVHELTPDLTLAPVQDAIDQVKARVASLDPAALLAPVDGAFAQVLAALDQYSPDRLIAPVEQRLTAARDKLVSDVKLREWGPALDTLAGQADGLINRFDPARLEPQIRGAIEEARHLLDRFPDLKLTGNLGSLFALLLTGSRVRIYPWTFEVVAGWLGPRSGTSDLIARATRIADAVARTRAAVGAIDPGAIAAGVSQRARALQAAVAALPDGSDARRELQVATARINVETRLGPLAGNRSRYLEALTRSATLAETLRRIGLSEVDVTIARLRQALGPLRVVTDLTRGIAAHAGLPGLESGFAAAMRGLLDVATPARLTAIALPIFIALRERIRALVDAVLAPIRAGIAETTRLVDAIDLAPLRAAVGGVFREARGQIEALQPSRLLAAPLAAMDALRADVAAFDPLAALRAVITALRDTVERILGTLRAETILASPLAIYDDILAALGSLDVEVLIAPILDLLDQIAGQVEDGLTRTVAAFKKLQDSLPSGEGSTLELVASVSIGF